MNTKFSYKYISPKLAHTLSVHSFNQLLNSLITYIHTHTQTHTLEIISIQKEVNSQIIIFLDADIQGMYINICISTVSCIEC